MSSNQPATTVEEAVGRQWSRYNRLWWLTTGWSLGFISLLASGQPSADSPTDPVAEASAAEGTPVVSETPGSPVSSEAVSPGSSAQTLAIDQGRLADRFRRLEEIAGRLAELSAGTDPERAALLREALVHARQHDVSNQFESTVDLLEAGRVSSAVKSQQQLADDLANLLELLLKEDRGNEVAQLKKWVRQQLQEVQHMIRIQRDVKLQTERDEKLKQLAARQAALAERAGQFADQIRQREGAGEPQRPERDSEAGSADSAERATGDTDQRSGNPSPQQPNENRQGPDQDAPPSASDQPSPPSQSEPSPSQLPQAQPSPSGPAQDSQSSGEPSAESSSSPPEPSDADQRPSHPVLQRVEAARERMREAQQRLEQAKRDGAVEQQAAALRELEQARAELERVLRQLREEEMERALEMLEARFRAMLEEQVQILDGTRRLDEVSTERRNHDEEIEAGRLSRRELALVREADKTLSLLLDEGTSVAFPEAVDDVRNDMQQVADRLARLQVDAFTQSVEEDIISALKDMVSAVQHALEELANNRTPAGQSPPPGQLTEPPLVEKIAELKMIRGMQVRVNERTLRLAELVERQQAPRPEFLDALRQLSERQERIRQATHDLHTGENQ